MNNFTEDYRNEFIEFISDLSEQFDSFDWWCTSVSEKNIFIGNSLFRILNGDDLELAGYDKFSLKKYYKSRRRFFDNNISNEVKFPDFEPSKKYIGLLTWIDDRNFAVDGEYKDTYFNQLYNQLKSRNDFLLLTNRLYTISNTKAQNLLRKNNIPFIDIFKCYRKSDVIKSILFSLYYNPLKKRIFFKKRNIAEILKRNIANDLIDNRFAQYYLMYYSIKRIAERGINFDRIIYPFENQPWEKILCYSVKKFMPYTKLIGYMHTAPLPDLVSLFPGKYEKEKMPQPDYIFTTGKLTADELKKNYDSKKIIENCALRYEYIFKAAPAGFKNKNKNILVALSVDYNKSLVMVYKVYQAFKDTQDYKIFIKAHPTYNLDLRDLRIPEFTGCENERIEETKIKSGIMPQNFEHGERSAEKEIQKNHRVNGLSTPRNYFLPEHFNIVNKPVSEILPDMELVLNCESTIGLEALKMHIPVIDIELKNFTHLSRMDYCPEIKISAGTTEEIVKKSEEILSWTEERKKIYFEKTDEFIKYCFNPVSEEYIERFLKI